METILNIFILSSSFLIIFLDKIVEKFFKNSNIEKFDDEMGQIIENLE